MNVPKPSGKVHPFADQFPLMPDDELDELAADIKENGLQYPLVLDANGDLIDGRNRKAACERAGIKPCYTVLDGQDPIAFILSMNIARRELNKGQKAMAIAFAYPEPEKGGRGKNRKETLQFSKMRLSQARQVLHHSRELAEAVFRDTAKLDTALEKVIAEQKALKTTEEKLAHLRQNAPDLAEHVAEDRLPLDEAYGAFEKRKRDAEEKEKSQRETICRVGEDSYRTIIAWSVEDFCKDIIQRLEDKEFRENFIRRIRLNRTEIPSVVNGAKALTEILNNL